LALKSEEPKEKKVGAPALWIFFFLDPLLAKIGGQIGKKTVLNSFLVGQLFYKQGGGDMAQDAKGSPEGLRGRNKATPLSVFAVWG